MKFLGIRVCAVSFSPIAPDPKIDPAAEQPVLLQLLSFELCALSLRTEAAPSEPISTLASTTPLWQPDVRFDFDASSVFDAAPGRVVDLVKSSRERPRRRRPGQAANVFTSHQQGPHGGAAQRPAPSRDRLPQGSRPVRHRADWVRWGPLRPRTTARWDSRQRGASTATAWARQADIQLVAAGYRAPAAVSFKRSFAGRKSQDWADRRPC